MNKKFSTLMAGLVLASGVAMAHNVPSAGGFPYRTHEVKSGTGLSETITKIDSENKWYQLTDGTNVLTQVRNEDTGEITLKMVTPTAADGADLNFSLWKIKVNKYSTSSAVKFTFINKETNLELVLDDTKATKDLKKADISTATVLDGCTKEWAWYQFAENANKFDVAPIYNYFHAGAEKDSVLLMVAKADGTVAAGKYAASDAIAANGQLNVADALKLKPVIAEGIVLSASDINSMLDAQPAGAAKFGFHKPDGKLNSELQTIFENTLTSSEYKAVNDTFSVVYGKLAMEASIKLLQAGVDSLKSVGKALDDINAIVKDAITADEVKAVTDAIDAAQKAVSNAKKASLKKQSEVVAALGAVKTALGNSKSTTGDVYAALNTIDGVLGTALGTSGTLGTGKDAKAQALATATKGYITEALTKVDKAGAELAAKGTIATYIATVGLDAYDSYAIRLTTDEGKKYFLVDTVRYENDNVSSANPPYMLVNKDLSNLKDSLEAGLINARSYFKLTYYPSNDSLLIEPLNAASQTDKEVREGTPWIKSIAGTKWVDDAVMTAAGVDDLGLTPSNTECNKDKTISLTVTKLSNGNLVATASVPNKNLVFDTRIAFANEYPYFVRTTAKEGVYLINLVTALAPSVDTRRVNGTNLVADMGGHIIYDKQEESQNFEHMPAAQWVIEHLGCNNAGNTTPRVKIVNREYGFTAFEGQLYKDNGNVYIINHKDYNNVISAHGQKFSCADTLQLTQIEEPNTLGYLNPGDKVIENTFKLKQFFDYGKDPYYLNAVKSGSDTLLRAQAEGSNFELIPVNVNVNYGYSNATAPQLKKSVYALKVKDADKINNDRIFVGVNKEGKYCVADTLENKVGYKLAFFTLKENNHWTKESDNHYYALVQVESIDGILTDVYKLAIEQSQLDAKQEDLCQDRTESFILESDTMPYYRRIFGMTTEKFYSVKNNGRTLGEVNEKGVNYLDIFSVAEESARNNEFFVDTARVSVPSMPTYLLALDVEKKQTAECDHTVHPADGVHYQVIEYLQGRYMLDAAYAGIIPDYVKVADYENVYTRYAFVNAIHYKDTLYIMDAADAAITYDRDLYNGKNVFKKIALKPEAYNGASIAFRLKEHDSNDFYLETSGKKYGYAEDGNTWVKEQNQTIVSTGHKSVGTDHEGKPNQAVKEDIYQALLLNTTAKDDVTANDEIAVSETVKVIAGNGEVTIYGAAGKKVKVYGLLGQEGKATILSSDMQTISAPSGIVIIAVEGEKAVKTIVK